MNDCPYPHGDCRYVDDTCDECPGRRVGEKAMRNEIGQLRTEVEDLKVPCSKCEQQRENERFQARLDAVKYKNCRAALLIEAFDQVLYNERARRRATHTELETWGELGRCDKCGDTTRLRRNINYPRGCEEVYYCLPCWDERKDAEIRQLKRSVAPAPKSEILPSMRPWWWTSRKEKAGGDHEEAGEQ